MDDFERELQAAGYQPINPDWLDADPVGQCRRCGRKTWSEEEIGKEDRMTQPDGDPCGGLIEATGATLPPMFTDHCSCPCIHCSNQAHWLCQTCKRSGYGMG